MGTPYGYGGVMGNQMGAMGGAPNQPGGMGGPHNSITMSAMMPPPPPPPPQGMADYANGMMTQVTNPMQQNIGHHPGAMGGPAMGGNILGQMMGPLQPPPPPPVNPATNDAPLDFNINRNQPPTPVSIQPGAVSTSSQNSNNMPSIIDITNDGSGIITSSTSGGGGGNMSISSDDGNGSSGNDRSDGGVDDKDRRNGRDRDRNGRDNRERDRDRARGGRGRDRDRDRDRSGIRGRLSREHDRDGSEGRDNRSRRRDVDRPIASNNTPMPDATSTVTSTPSIENQQFNPMGAANPWASMWNPMANAMGGAMAGPMGPMGPMTPMAGPMTGPVGPMGPMTPMGPMPTGPMGPGEGQALSGEFRITWGMFGWTMSAEGMTIPVKNMMHCKEVTLVPPNRLAPPPTTRERPMGCRTIFVGGLPENITEEMVVDVFERCGDISTVRLSKKNFAHIRYELEEFVENAIFLSGYRMRISNSTDAFNTGRLHVDYAQARDDLYEWECRQRALQREQRHRERMEQEMLRPPSPPPVPHYTEHEASVVAEHLKGDETGNVTGEDIFSKAAATLVTWLERGDCSKRNTGTFYSMIQSTNSQVRKLLAEKMQYEEELSKFKEQTRARMQGIMSQFGQIEKVFTACSQQKVWDHFTKAQRRNIDMWKKQAQEVKRIQLDDSDKEDADEMDVSDDESPKLLKSKKPSANDALKEENDSLRCQLEAYKNEVDMVKVDMKADLQSKDEQINTYKQTLQGMQQALSENVSRKRKDEARIAELNLKLKKLQDALKKAKKEEKDKASVGSLDDKDDEKELIYEDGDDLLLKDDTEEEIEVVPVTSSIGSLDDKIAWLIGLTSTFLHIHPKGASVDYIWSYIQQFDKEIRPLDVESMLNQFPSVYKQITTGVGACLERKWIFTGFKSPDGGSMMTTMMSGKTDW